MTDVISQFRTHYTETELAEVGFEDLNDERAFWTGRVVLLPPAAGARQGNLGTVTSVWLAAPNSGFFPAADHGKVRVPVYLARVTTGAGVVTTVAADRLRCPNGEPIVSAISRRQGGARGQAA